ncbi:MAG TPA: signal recognition particle protein [Steroidobacteraceae bacterium]|nr:signal recognition particle protein [Steroidobacteraceae bacterium]
MFDRLTTGLTRALNALSGRGYLSENNIADTVREVRLALLDADVALSVVKSFTEAIKARAIGVEVTKSLTPGQAFIKVVHEELVRLMGEPSTGLNLRAQRPVVVMLAGLQGAGKTTTVAKLARWLIEKQHKRVLVVSTDVYRPAAIEQLRTLAAQVGAGFAPAHERESPLDIAKRALTEATLQAYDVLLLDTAGRLHVDADMMNEVRELEAALNPHERLFVVDSMAGQDAVNAARAFNEVLSLTGVILTKADGDARGGAALSVRQVTGKPILFVGTGEKTEALELFQPERIASRILGMGDVLSLVEQVQEQVDRDKAEKLAKKLSKGKPFDLADLREQLSQLQKMGGMSALLDKLPAQLQANAAAASGAVNPRTLKRQMGIIDSMTPRERRRPEIIDGSRKRRIAAGAGVQLPEVNRLLKQFDQMQKTMKKLSKGGMLKNLMRGMGGQLPPGFGGPKF